MDFPTRLKNLRLEKGCSLRDVSRCASVSKSSIEAYESGKRKPKYETLEALADFYNVSIDYILCRTNNPNIQK